MLSGWNLIDDFRRRLSSVQAASAPEESPARAGGPVRKLLVGDYFSLFLFGLLNPVVESMRGLCAVSHITRVGRDVCSRPVSLGSFSEAQSVFDPNLLKGGASLIYHYRWQVELFFKWLKCILGCRHLLAESPEGVTIQIYCALIAALMLQALTGKRPSKREMELIRFYMAGSMEVDELMTLLARERERLERLEKSAQERKKNWL